MDSTRLTTVIAVSQLLYHNFGGIELQARKRQFGNLESVVYVVALLYDKHMEIVGCSVLQTCSLYNYHQIRISTQAVLHISTGYLYFS